KGKKRLDKIDMTPLIDLTFILLIVFMLTAPVLESSMNIDPPSMSAGEIKSDPNNRTINVDRSGIISYNGHDYSLEQLLLFIVDEVSNNRQLRYFVRGDKRVSYGDVAEVVACLQKNGVKNVSLVFEKLD
ncbi:MAG: ExbD/TolR family protein, partial [Lentisphaeria bacterium]